MKTYLKILSLCLILLTGSTVIFARGRGGDRDQRGNRRGHRVDNKYSSRENRGRNYHYAVPENGHQRIYYPRAPWGISRPYHIVTQNRGRLYFYRGHYYEFHPTRGYMIVNAPIGYEFDAVPRGFTRIWIDNAWCYHRGDFYLRPSARGYISFNRPGISIGASF